MATVTATVELSQPLVSGLSFLIILFTCTAVIPNSLVIIGVTLGEESVFWRTMYVTMHTCACVAPVVLSSTSFLYANNAGVLQDVTGCLLVSCVQIFAVSEYTLCTFCSNLIWTLDVFRPGFYSQHEKLLTIGIVASLVLPLFAVSTSAGVFLGTQQIELSLNSTNLTQTCNWSMFPSWFPFGFAYGLIIPANIFLFISTVQVMRLAFKKSRIIEAQITAVALNGRPDQNGSARMVVLGRRRLRNVLIGSVNVFLLHAPIVSGTLLMLHCSSEECLPQYVLNSIWTILVSITATQHGTAILIYTSNIKKGIKQFMSDISCPRQQ